jgi:proteasome lid subunit RPN8/RPN11
MEEFTKPKVTFGDTLRFTAYAYSKLLCMRDLGPTEVAGYGITATKDPLLVTDFVLVKQKCNPIHFELDPEDNAEHTERMMDIGVPPWACMNLLIHSHPGNSPHPSANDEENFKEAFSHPNWAIMLIIAKDGSTYCRLKMNTAPGVEKLLKVTVDWSVPFGSSNAKAWEEEYNTKVVVEEFQIITKTMSPSVTQDMEDPLWKDLLCKDIECYWNSDGNASHWDEEEAVWYVYNPTADEWWTEDEDLLEVIPNPNEPLIEQIKAWATKYANERELVMDD